MSSCIVAVDGSGPSRAALRWAMTRAAETNTPVLLAHVIEDEWGLAGGDFAREAAFAGARLLQEALGAAKTLNPSARVDTRLLHGSPVRELADTCTADDVLVIGTHKTGFLRGRVLGSRSVSIAGVAPCSVIVVPEGRPSERRGIVAGVAGPGGAFLGVASAAREAARLGQSLLLVHATPRRLGPPVDADADRERHRQLVERAVHAATQAAPEVDLQMRLLVRDPADALLDAARESTLLVLEPTRGHDPDGNPIGSTTHDVLMNITCPVLIARRDHI
jgi:nucleotide-binding universal stress UspA family protein